MIIVHRFHIEPTKEQEQKLFQTPTLCRWLYNIALEQREVCYRQKGNAPSCTSQKNELPALKKELPEYKQINAQVLQDCLQRLDDTFQRFFSCLAGYPHYKDRDLRKVVKKKNAELGTSGSLPMDKNRFTLQCPAQELNC